MSTMNLVILFAASVLFCLAAIIDLQQRRIPNVVVLAVVALALIRIDLHFDIGSAFNDIEWAGLVLIGSLVFWRFRWLGGGDVKLIFAGALLVGRAALSDFILLTILLGGALGVLAFADMWLERNYGWSTGLAFPRADMSVRSADLPTPRKGSVPYGIAVAFAGVFTLLIHSSIPGWH